MNCEQFEREKAYSAGLAIAKNLLSRGHITASEYRNVKAALMDKYRPVVCFLYAHDSFPAPDELTPTAAIAKKKGA